LQQRLGLEAMLLFYKKLYLGQIHFESEIKKQFLKKGRLTYMIKVTVAENILQKELQKEISEAVSEKNVKDEEEFVILHKVAFVGKLSKGIINIERMFPKII
jgi:hypothetical protein